MNTRVNGWTIRLLPAWLVMLLAAGSAACFRTADSQLETNKDLVHRFVAVSNDRDFDELDRIVVPGFLRHCQATPGIEIRSLGEFKKFLEQDAATFPDSRVTIQKILAEGNLVAVWALYEGTQEGQMGPFPPSGRRMELDFGGVFRIEDGMIAELWLTWDNLSVLTQLGHSPP